MRAGCYKRAVLILVSLIIISLQSCTKKDDKDEKPAADSADVDGDDNDGRDEDALPKDEYRGVYKLNSQLETPYNSCDDATAVPPDEFGSPVIPPYFKLDLEYEFAQEDTSERKVDLWLYSCSDEKTCGDTVLNFLFPDKIDGVWGGPTSYGQGKSYEDPSKCSFSYTERYAKLSGNKNILITRTDYSGDVEPLGNGNCLDEEGVNSIDYYNAYRGKLKCIRRETVTAEKLALPMPE